MRVRGCTWLISSGASAWRSGISAPFSSIGRSGIDAAIFWAKVLQFGIILAPLGLYETSRVISGRRERPRMMIAFIALHGLFALSLLTHWFVQDVKSMAPYGYWTIPGPLFWTLSRVVHFPHRQPAVFPLQRGAPEHLAAENAAARAPPRAGPHLDRGHERHPPDPRARGVDQLHPPALLPAREHRGLHLHDDRRLQRAPAHAAGCPRGARALHRAHRAVRVSRALLALHAAAADGAVSPAPQSARLRLRARRADRQRGPGQHALPAPLRRRRGHLRAQDPRRPPRVRRPGAQLRPGDDVVHRFPDALQRAPPAPDEDVPAGDLHRASARRHRRFPALPHPSRWSWQIPCRR